MWTMPKKDEDFSLPTKTLRFTPEELARLRPVMRRVRQRNSLATPSDMLKDLMGLTDNGLLTDEDRASVKPHATRRSKVSGVKGASAVGADSATRSTGTANTK